MVGIDICVDTHLFAFLFQFLVETFQIMRWGWLGLGTGTHNIWAELEWKTSKQRHKLYAEPRLSQVPAQQSPCLGLAEAFCRQSHPMHSKFGEFSEFMIFPKSNG